MGKKREFYYGWIIVYAATFITFLTVGMRMSIGPFFLPMLEDFEISRTGLSAIIATGMFLYGVGMPLAGYLEKRWGTKFVLISGSIIVFLSSLWAKFSSTPFELLMSFGVFLSLGLAFTSQIAFTPIISRWFIKRKGQALFYLSTGSMAGIAGMNPVVTFLIRSFGWHQAILIFAIVFLLIVLPTALFIIREDVPEGADVGPDATGVKPKVKPQDPHPDLTLREAFKTLPFWQIAIGLFACGYGMNLLGTHGIPMLVDHGFTEVTASLAIGAIGLAAIPGTLIMGYFADRVPRKNLLALIYFVRGLAFIFLVMVTVVFQLYIVALISGVVWAGNMALSSAIMSDIYGVRLVGIMFGWAYFSHQVAATISSLLGGWAFETFHTHWISFGSAAVVLFIASFVSLRLPTALKRKKQMKTNVSTEVPSH